MSGPISPQDPASDVAPGPAEAERDPRETDHPVGEEQAERNIDDEPAG